jgi:hypothetical protein
MNRRTHRTTVGRSDLRAVIDFLVRNPHGHFHETWRGLDRTERATLAALANTIRDETEFVSEEAIHGTLVARRFPADLEQLRTALAALLQTTHLLERASNRYRFRIDLLREWICFNYQTGEDLDER